MATPTNDVLAERIDQIRNDLSELKRQTREEIRDLEAEVEKTRRIADEVNTSTKYIREAVGELRSTVDGFIGVVNEQNKKIDDFVNSEKRMDSKKQLIVSSLQVVSGVIIALIGMWASGKL